MQTRLQCPQCKAKSQFAVGAFRKLEVLAPVIMVTFTLIMFTDFFFLRKKAICDLNSAWFLLISNTVVCCFAIGKRPYLKLTPVLVQPVASRL
jgi:hypothetical protein